MGPLARNSPKRAGGEAGLMLGLGLALSAAGIVEEQDLPQDIFSILKAHLVFGCHAVMSSPACASSNVYIHTICVYMYTCACVCI